METKGSYVHTKTGNWYEVISTDVINATNSAGEERMVIYQGDLKDGSGKGLFVREYNEFMSKFVHMIDLQVGKIYNSYDDGKVIPVTIRGIVDFDDIDEDTLSIWESEVEKFPGLISVTTDFFVEGSLDIGGRGVERVVFVRDVNDGWLSLGYRGARLDVDGNLSKTLNVHS